MESDGARGHCGRGESERLRGCLRSRGSARVLGRVPARVLGDQGGGGEGKDGDDDRGFHFQSSFGEESEHRNKIRVSVESINVADGAERRNVPSGFDREAFSWRRTQTGHAACARRSRPIAGRDDVCPSGFECYDRFMARCNLGARVFSELDLVIPFEYGFCCARCGRAWEAERFVTNASAAGIDFASVAREPGF